MIQRVARTIAVALAMGVAGCGSATIDEPNQEAEPKYTLSLISPTPPRTADAFSILSDTIVFEMRDAAGQLVKGGFIAGGVVTGWVQQIGSTRWIRSGVVIGDSTGRVRLRWQFSGSPVQHLDFGASGTASSVHIEVPLQRPAALLRADTVVTSGPAAVCIQQAGRVGCVGDGRCATCPGISPISREPGRLNWFAFEGPVVKISSTSVGACALLADGSTACWQGLGPDSVARNDAGHPPFVELRGIAGLTATGDVWIGPTSYQRVRTWLRMPADSAISALLEPYNELAICGRTASNVVMCGSGPRTTATPPFQLAPMTVLRDGQDSSVVHADGGFTAQLYSTSSSVDQIVVHLARAGSTTYSLRSNISSGWFARAAPDATLSGADPTVRECVPELQSTCSVVEPWRSISQAGLIETSHISYEYGYRRICGVRSIVVCYTRDATGRLQSALTYQVSPLVSVDTIRLAP
jgi:hypothetical protein